MTGQLHIDGIDAYRKFGVFITKGGYDELLKYPPLKKVNSNEWPEEDGEEFDLSAPVLDSRELTLKFAAQGVKFNIGALVELLADGAYHSFEFREIGRTYNLRLLSQSNLKLARRTGLFFLRVADDFPLNDYTYKEPLSSLAVSTGYELDGVDFAKYGVCTLKGSREQIEQMPAIKKNLLRDIKSQSGVIYDGQIVRFQTKDVKLKCLMRAHAIAEFWHNYNALIFDLTRPGERILYVDEAGCEYPCYYKSCSDTAFAPGNTIWFEFTLELVFSSFRVVADEYLLASEVGEWIVAEENNFIIDLGE